MQRRGKLHMQTCAQLYPHMVISETQTEHNAGVLDPLAYLHVLRRQRGCTSIEAVSGREALIFSWFQLQCFHKKHSKDALVLPRKGITGAVVGSFGPPLCAKGQYTSGDGPGVEDTDES